MTDVLAGDAAPVIPAADAAPIPAPTADQEIAPEGEKKPEPPEKMLPQSEVNKLIARRVAQAERNAAKVARAEAERDHYKQIAERTQVQQPQPQGRPVPTNFKDYESYTEALTDWKVDQKLSEHRGKQQQETEAQRQQRDQQDFASRLQQKIRAAAKELPDIEDVISGDIPFTQPMVAFVADSDLGAQVAYHLGNHPEEAQRIANLSPAGVFRELVKLEAKLGEPAKPTQAPAPITPVGGIATGDKNPDKMSIEEWRKWREASLRRKK